MTKDANEVMKCKRCGLPYDSRSGFWFVPDISEELAFNYCSEECWEAAMQSYIVKARRNA